jgi:hypothetical protein
MVCISEGGEQRQSLWSKEFNKNLRLEDQKKKAMKINSYHVSKLCPIFKDV